MELDLQSLFGLHVHSCTHWLRPRNPPPPHLGSYVYVRGRHWSAKIDDISLWLPDFYTSVDDIFFIGAFSTHKNKECNYASFSLFDLEKR